MTFLPLVERELRVRSRRSFTYWLRVYVGGLGIFICLMQFVLSGAMGGAATAGGYAFNALVVSAFMFCCGACLMTATAISSERSEGTLPLLFLTNVKSNDVLLGKLLPALLAGLCALGAYLPILMITVLSGGVTGGEIARTALALIHTLFLALVLGLRASTNAKSWLGAIRSAILLLLGWNFLPFLFEVFVPLHWNTISLLSPLRVLILANDSYYNFHPGAVTFWVGIGVLHLLGWGLLLNTARQLRKSLVDRVVEDPLVKFLIGSPPVITRPPLATNQPPVLEVNMNFPPVAMVPSAPVRRSVGDSDPLQWLIRRQRGVTSMIWFGAIIAALHTLMFGSLSFIGSGFTYLLIWPVNLGLSILKSCFFAWAVTRFFVHARQSGELELLGTTPQGARLLVTAQQIAMKYLFRGPLVLMFMALALQSFAWMAAASHRGSDWGWITAISTIMSVVYLFVGVTALIWVGIWAGLTARSQGKAVLITVWWVTILPGLASWGASIISMMIRNVGRLPSMVTYYLSGLVVLLVFAWLIHRTKRLLARELRDAQGLTGSLFTPATSS